MGVMVGVPRGGRSGRRLRSAAHAIHDGDDNAYRGRQPKPPANGTAKAKEPEIVQVPDEEGNLIDVDISKF